MLVLLEQEHDVAHLVELQGQQVDAKVWQTAEALDGVQLLSCSPAGRQHSQAPLCLRGACMP